MTEQHSVDAKGRPYIEALRRFRYVLSSLKGCDPHLLNREKVLYLLKSTLEGLLLLKGVNPPAALDVVNIAAIAHERELITSRDYASIALINVLLRTGSVNDEVVTQALELIKKLVSKASEIDPYVSLDAEIFRY